MTTDIPIELLEREDWAFEVTVDGHAYRVVWLTYIRNTDGFEENHLVATRDGVSFHNDASEVAAVVEAAVAYRTHQLKKERHVDYNAAIDYKQPILALARRAWAGEFLGQSPVNFLYVQRVAEILELGFIKTRELSEELAKEGKLRLVGNILFPYDTPKLGSTVSVNDSIYVTEGKVTHVFENDVFAVTKDNGVTENYLARQLTVLEF
jgi:ribosomal 50S subunit-recycling heat shock protein